MCESGSSEPLCLYLGQPKKYCRTKSIVRILLALSVMFEKASSTIIVFVHREVWQSHFSFLFFFLLLLRIFARNKESIANIMNMPKFLRKTLFYPFTFLKLRKKLFYVLFMASYNNFHFASDNILSLANFKVDDPAIKVVGNVIYC